MSLKLPDTPEALTAQALEFLTQAHMGFDEMFADMAACLQPGADPNKIRELTGTILKVQGALLQLHGYAYAIERLHLAKQQGE